MKKLLTLATILGWCAYYPYYYGYYYYPAYYGWGCGGWFF